MNTEKSIRIHLNSLFSTLTYRISNTLIDPGDEWEGFEVVDTVLLTHAHFDHIYGLNELFAKNPKAKVFTNSIGKEMLLNARKNLSFYHETPFVFKYPDKIVTVNDGEEIQIADDLIAKAVFTPGHNPSCISWVIVDDIFTGDSYIPGIKTVTNLPGSDKALAKKSENLILNLAKNRTIHPGHLIP